MMNDLKKWMKPILRLSVLGTLYVLAAPIYLALGTLKINRLIEGFLAVASGRIICHHCQHENVLNRLATCNKCKATEYGSVLYCSFCHQVTRVLFCEGCGVTLRVIPEATL
jgi:hypothetical protein